MKKNSESGFTLIELLVVIGIIGILAIVAVPALFNNINKAKIAKLQSEAEAVKTAELTYYAENDRFTELNNLDIEGLNTDKSPLGGIYKLYYKNSETNEILDASGKNISSLRVDVSGKVYGERVHLDEYGDIFLAIQGSPDNKIYMDQKQFKNLVDKFGSDNVFAFSNPSGFGWQNNEFYIRLTNNIVKPNK